MPGCRPVCDSLPVLLEQIMVIRDQAKNPAIAIETYFFNADDDQERHELS
jgi:hypothetical protein